MLTCLKEKQDGAISLKKEEEGREVCRKPVTLYVHKGTVKSSHGASFQSHMKDCAMEGMQAVDLKDGFKSWQWHTCVYICSTGK